MFQEIVFFLPHPHPCSEHIQTALMTQRYCKYGRTHTECIGGIVFATRYSGQGILLLMNYSLNKGNTQFRCLLSGGSASLFSGHCHFLYCTTTWMPLDGVPKLYIAIVQPLLSIQYDTNTALAWPDKPITHCSHRTCVKQLTNQSIILYLCSPKSHPKANNKQEPPKLEFRRNYGHQCGC